MRRGGLSKREQADIWRRYGIGESLRSISRTVGRDMGMLRSLIASTGGRQPRELRRSELRLSLAEREEISRGLVAGDSGRQIARRLKRAPSTVSREIARNGGRERYRACEAERVAFTRARRPKPTKLGSFPQLRHAVEALLQLRWSPQQIAGWLTRVGERDRGFRVSHETIYLALFVQPRATLSKQLTRYLRSRRKQLNFHSSLQFHRLRHDPTDSAHSRLSRVPARSALGTGCAQGMASDLSSHQPHPRAGRPYPGTQRPQI
jgi:transposase, IS30 family